VPGKPAPAYRQRWLLPALIVILSLTVGGGLLAREVYRKPQPDDTGEVAATSASTLPPEQQPGPPTVQLTPDAAAHPEDQPVRQLLQMYFDSINNRNYDLWKTIVTSARIQSQPRDEWLANYRTTHDGSILVYRIEGLARQQLQILVTFTSVQDPADAPLELPERCIRWRLVLPAVWEGNAWKLDTVPAGTSPDHTKC